MTEKHNPFQTVAANDPDWLDKVAHAARYGSGVAVDFSEVRPKGEPIKPEPEPIPAGWLDEEPFVKPYPPLVKVGVWVLCVAIPIFGWALIFALLGWDYASKIGVNVASVLGLFGGFTVLAGWGLHYLSKGEN